MSNEGDMEGSWIAGEFNTAMAGRLGNPGELDSIPRYNPTVPSVTSMPNKASNPKINHFSKFINSH